MPCRLASILDKTFCKYFKICYLPKYLILISHVSFILRRFSWCFKPRVSEKLGTSIFIQAHSSIIIYDLLLLIWFWARELHVFPLLSLLLKLPHHPQIKPMISMLYWVHFSEYIPGPLLCLTSHSDAKKNVDFYENSALKMSKIQMSNYARES